MDTRNQGENTTKGFLFGAIIGGAVGAVAALLLAPKSGRELRKELYDKSNEFYDSAGRYVTEMEGNVERAVSTTVNEGRSRAQNIINSARHQAEDILEKAEQVLNDARTKAGDAKEQVQERIEHIRDAAKASASAFKTELEESKQEGYLKSTKEDIFGK
ncbi:MAG: YtxH domain-containing protein [Candidatus Kapaibacterium sp.]